MSPSYYMEYWRRLQKLRIKPGYDEDYETFLLEVIDGIWTILSPDDRAAVEKIIKRESA